MHLFERLNERGEDRNQGLPSADSLPTWLKFLGLPGGPQGPKYLSHFHCFLRCISRKAYGKPSCWVTNQNCHMGCQCHKQYLNLLCHNASSNSLSWKRINGLKKLVITIHWIKTEWFLIHSCCMKVSESPVRLRIWSWHLEVVQIEDVFNDYRCNNFIYSTNIEWKPSIVKSHLCQSK